MAGRWELADRLNGTGHLRLDEDGCVFDASRSAGRLLSATVPNRDALLALARPEERQVLALTLERAQPSTARMTVGSRLLQVKTRLEPAGGVLVALRDVSSERRRRRHLEHIAELMRMAERAADLGHWHYDLASGEVHWSDMVYRIHGFEPGQIEPDFELVMKSFHPDDAAQLQACVQRAVTEGKAYDVPLRLVRPGEPDRSVRARGEAIRGLDGEVSSLFGILQDLGQQQRSAELSDLFEDVVRNTQEAIIVTDADGIITWTNEAFTRFTGYTAEEAAGHKPGALLQGPGTRPEQVASMRERLQRGEGFVEDLLNYAKDGTPHHVRLSVRPRRSPTGELMGFTSVQVDVTELHEIQQRQEEQRSQLQQVIFRLERQNAEQERLLAENARARAALQREVETRARLEHQLRRMALFDALTDVPNRRYTLTLLRTEISRARRYAHPVSALMLDIDHFKQVNDTHGHAIGDEVLKHVAKVVGGCLRDIDHVGRTGGEEFVVVLSDTDLLGAQAVAERVRSTVGCTPCSTEEGLELQVTLSVGVAELRSRESLESLLQRADAAMYVAKQTGRDRCALAEEPVSEDDDATLFDDPQRRTA